MRPLNKATQRSEKPPKELNSRLNKTRAGKFYVQTPTGQSGWLLL
jgi:hypothetical protein